MDFLNKKVIVIGIGISGISVCKLLIKLGANVTIVDNKNIDDIKYDLSELKNNNVNIITSKNPDDFILDYDIIVVSPSVSLTSSFITKAKKHNALIIPEIEVAYFCLKGNIIGITGTNGKTTTTDLTYNIFKNAYDKVFEVGNIGTPISDYALQSNDDSYFITELSSYMLEAIDKFHVNTAIVLNIADDHLIRHKTMENYILAKKNILKNQTKKDFLILNYDDEVTKEFSKDSVAKVLYFTLSNNDKLDMYVNDGAIYENITGNNLKLIDIKNIKLLGNHNLYNIMASTLSALCNGINKKIIVDTLQNYYGVEHRLEYVKTINCVNYYNDSKATNVASTLCAIDAMVSPTVLIAGGDEKFQPLDELVLKIIDKIEYCVFAGTTKNKLAELCIKYGYNNFYVADSYDEAVEYSKKIAKPNWSVLFSPACASFDYFDNFEHRGNYFKKLVLKI